MAADGLAANRESLKTKLLVLHGADLRFVAYPGAVHAFTQKGARNENSRGTANNATAGKKSWKAMQDFFEAIFFRELRIELPRGLTGLQFFTFRIAMSRGRA